MLFELNKQQKKAIETDENRFVVACPGSGKTSVALAKLLFEAANFDDDSQSVLALTFSTSAKSELERRVDLYAGPNSRRRIEVNTLHGFAMSRLVSPHGLGFLGFAPALAVPGSFIYEEALLATLAKSPLTGKALRDNLENCRRGVDGDPYVLTAALTGAARESVLMFWQELQTRGYVDYASSLYIGYQILLSKEWVREGIAATVPCIVVDEYQDCNDIQIAILRVLEKAGCQMFLVGDLDQCVFGFAGANVKTLEEFANEIAATTFSLEGSYRCPTSVLQVANRVFPRNIEAVGKAAERHDGFTEILVGGDAISNLRSFIERCDQANVPRSDVAFICAWNIQLVIYVEALEKAGIRAIVAKPQRKPGDEFGDVVVAILQCLKPQDEAEITSLATALYGCSSSFTLGKLGSRQSATLLQNACEELVYTGFSIESPTVRDSLPQIATLALSLLASSMAYDATEILTITNGLSDAVRRFAEDPLTRVTIAEYVSKSRCDNCVRGYTYQGIKGLEFEAIAILDVEDPYMPNFKANDWWEEIRKLYVGLTRSKHHLMITSATVSAPFMSIASGQRSVEAVMKK